MISLFITNTTLYPNVSIDARELQYSLIKGNTILSFLELLDQLHYY